MRNLRLDMLVAEELELKSESMNPELEEDDPIEGWLLWICEGPATGVEEAAPAMR